MRIERIKSSRLIGLGDVDWTFPIGPVLVFCEDRSQLSMMGKLLMELLYDPEAPHAIKAESNKGLLEMWMAGENTRYHIRRDFIQHDSEFVRSTTVVSEEISGQTVGLPGKLTLGDHLLGVNLRSFCQGVLVDWQGKNERDDLRLRVNNLRQGGDEELSLIKVRASLVGAQKKVSGQKGSIELVKTEYDTLRREWEAANRQQDVERLLLIEIKNLQENEAVLSEKIASTIIIQERLEYLTQNPDYRELRQLQGEITQLEERLRVVELNLMTLTSESKVDWALIESLREECIEWANLQEKVERFSVEAQIRAENIAELRGTIQACGYDGLWNDEDRHLSRVEEERDLAQDEISKLINIKEDLESTQLVYSNELGRLQDLADMASVTDADEVKLAQREKHLKQWQNSIIGGSLDRTLRKRFSATGIGEKLAFRLDQYYKRYHTLNYKEFGRRLKDFRDQQKLVERLQLQVERLQDKIGREDILHMTVHSRTDQLKQALIAAGVPDFPTWLNGWKEYQINKTQLSLQLNELQLLREQSKLERNLLQVCTEQLREKLGAWDTPATNRDEVLETVLKVASQLRAKDETEREIAAYSQKYKGLLGNRNIERLAKKMEPLADLEREKLISDDERQGELTAWYKERLHSRRQRAEAQQRLEHHHKYPSITVLEKKIENVKRQWATYEDIYHAIEDAQVLLETSWEEWQDKFGKTLNSEVKWILSKISSLLTHETIQRDLVEAKRHYFAYRMAIAQLSLGSFVDIPLLFSIGEVDENEGFWVDVIEYFHKLSLTRQMILITADAKLRKKLSGIGWSSLS